MKAPHFPGDSMEFTRNRLKYLWLFIIWPCGYESSDIIYPIKEWREVSDGHWEGHDTGSSWQIKRFVTKVINTIVKKNTEEQHCSGVSKERLDFFIETDSKAEVLQVGNRGHVAM